MIIRLDFLLDYTYLKESYKFIVIDLSKKQTLDASPKENLDWGRETTILSVIKYAKQTILGFSHGNVRILRIYFSLIYCQYKMTQHNLNDQYNHNTT